MCQDLLMNILFSHISCLILLICCPRFYIEIFFLPILQCVPILGRGFETGGYKCQCNQGYEYPFNDYITYFDGQITEAEFEKLLKNFPSRYDTLKCRIAGAATICAHFLTILLLFLSHRLLFQLLKNIFTLCIPFKKKKSFI